MKIFIENLSILIKITRVWKKKIEQTQRFKEGKTNANSKINSTMVQLIKWSNAPTNIFEQKKNSAEINFFIAKHELCITVK